MIDIELLCRRAKKASRSLALASTSQKNRFLAELEQWLLQKADRICLENEKDVLAAKKKGLVAALIDRLTLTDVRVRAMASDIRQVIELNDPIGEVIESFELPSKLSVRKERVPLGVLAVVYESRPNVTVDVAALAIKSGNSVILRGGSETINSNRILVEGIHTSLQTAGLDNETVQFIDRPDRELVTQLLRMHHYVDMLIPRGGAGLHSFCRENSNIPVITGGIGICHLFVDESANLEKAINVIRNAKIQRPTVCNALDTVLVHRSIASVFIPMLVSHMLKNKVSLRIDSHALKGTGITINDAIQLAGEKDFDIEWLSLVLGIKVVEDLEGAIDHISKHSTGHSDGILTSDKSNAKKFTNEVDSAVVYVNASTRFTDGAQLGLGAEVAVSTQRLHARGPMALRELTTYKWVVMGDYHIRD